MAFVPAAAWYGLAAAAVSSTASAVIANNSKPKAVAPTPQVPTVDTSQQANLQQQDLLARRRGVLQNIYAGASSAAPSVSSKSQLGN